MSNITYAREYREKNREKIRKYHREYARKRRGSICRVYKYDIPKGLPDKERMRVIRVIVLKHYSKSENPTCSCCGENEIKFLSIDHINGGGNEHRRSISKGGRGGNMPYWLLRNDLPEGFQVLCHNCNMAKAFYGQCPHIKVDK